MAFPSTFSSFTYPSASDRLNNPSHSALHNTTSSVLGQVETIIGLDGDASILGTLIGDLRSPGSGGGGHVQTAVKGGTGQTTYTKGDILVAQSASVLSKLAVGTNDTVPIADSAAASGIRWGAVPAIVVSSTVAVSSIWTKPAAATATSRVFVELWGGGGSGGASAGANEAGGGGGGGYASGWFSASVLSSVIINVGRGGNAVQSSQGGLAGSITVFDPLTSMLTAYAGGGGASNGSNAGGGGGAGDQESGTSATGAPSGTPGRMYGSGSNDQYTGVFISNLGLISVGASIIGSGRTFRTLMGGGGGPSEVNTAPVSVVGGNAVYGGGGGAGIGSSVVSGSVQGGLSTFGGRGGNSSIMTSGSAMAGFVPGGGGGAGYGTGISSGPGATGMAKITVFL